MGDKVWVIYREECTGYDSIYDDKVYVSKEMADSDAEGLNKGGMYKYYVDYLDVL